MNTALEMFRVMMCSLARDEARHARQSRRQLDLLAWIVLSNGFYLLLGSFGRGWLGSVDWLLAAFCAFTARRLHQAARRWEQKWLATRQETLTLLDTVTKAAGE